MTVGFVDSLLILQTGDAETEVALVEDVCRANRVNTDRYYKGARTDNYAALWIMGGVDLSACLNRSVDGCEIFNEVSGLVSNFYESRRNILAPCMAILIALKALYIKERADKPISWRVADKLIVSDTYRLISTNRPLLGLDKQVKQNIYMQMLACLR
jgi:hypothetical protein